MKYIRLTVILLILWTGSYASGIISMGIMAGASNDAGNIKKISADINAEMREYQIANANTTVTEIDNTYTPLIAVNLSYIKEFLVIKAGWNYTSNILYKPKGSITPPAGQENRIELDYTRFTFPVSAGIAVPLTPRDRLYFCGGLNMSYVMFKISQSDPVPGLLASYPDKTNTFSAFTAGSQILFGAETVLDRNYSFAVEFTKYFGNPKKVQNEEEDSEIFIGLNSFEVTAGIIYNIDFKNR